MARANGVAPDAGLIAPGAALVDAASGRRLVGAGLSAALAPISAAYQRLPPGPIFALTDRTLGAVLRYLAAVAVGRPVAVLDPDLPGSTLADLVARYRPSAVVGIGAGAAFGARLGERLGAGDQCPPDGYVPDRLAGGVRAWRRLDPTHPGCHPELAILLATSGSTGSPKLVRLSRSNLLANCASIVAALHLDEREVAVTSLPLCYTYGLSVLNSHLSAGATVVVAGADVLSAEFWRACQRYGVTTLAGVPHTYRMLAGIRWTPAMCPSLRWLTQSGGPMPVELARHLHAQIAGRGGRLYLMYGQTEATARITVLPPDRVMDRPGSVGLAVPGGKLSIVAGEVVYRSPSVMLGYAEDAADLGRGDELGGVLMTGDLGHLDESAFLFLTGRLRRTGKVFGVRVNLDEIERMVTDEVGLEVAAVADDDRIVVWCAGAPDAVRRAVSERLTGRLRLHRSGFDVRAIDRLPLLPNGKFDYRRLEGGALR